MSALAGLNHILCRRSLNIFADLQPDLVGNYIPTKISLKFKSGNREFFSIELLNLLLSLIEDEIILIFPVDMRSFHLILYKHRQETIIHTQPVHSLSTTSRQLCSHSTRHNQQVREPIRLLEKTINQTSMLTCNSLLHLQYI